MTHIDGSSASGGLSRGLGAPDWFYTDEEVSAGCSACQLREEFSDAKLDVLMRVCDTGKLEGSLLLGGGDGFVLQVAAGLAEVATDSNLAGAAVEVPLAATVELAYAVAVELPCYEYAQALGIFGALADVPALAEEDTPFVHFADFAAGRSGAAGKPAGNWVAPDMEESPEHLVFFGESHDMGHADDQVQESSGRCGL